MTVKLESIRPGIIAIFEAVGIQADVGLEKGTVKISLYTKKAAKTAEPTETRIFPLPTTNRDLSADLLRWRDELIAGGAKK